MSRQPVTPVRGPETRRPDGRRYRTRGTGRVRRRVVAVAHPGTESRALQNPHAAPTLTNHAVVGEDTAASDTPVRVVPRSWASRSCVTSTVSACRPSDAVSSHRQRRCSVVW